MAHKLNPDLKFRLEAWDKGLVFQIMEFKPQFWTLVSTVVPTNTYVASNGVTVKIHATTADITRIQSNNEITIANGTPVPPTSMYFNPSNLFNMADNTQRDTCFNKIVSALREFVIFVNNNGSLPHFCHHCFNLLFETAQQTYPKTPKFCSWINEVGSGWDIDAHYCVNFNVTAPGQLQFNIYEL